jgi:hypothetical protein|tara:strand:- start:600 stop:884 length:285 start_codon:yes stop_codon:yes gene_type:complete
MNIAIPTDSDPGVDSVIIDGSNTGHRAVNDRINGISLREMNIDTIMEVIYISGRSCPAFTESPIDPVLLIKGLAGPIVGLRENRRDDPDQTDYD